MDSRLAVKVWSVWNMVNEEKPEHEQSCPEYTYTQQKS